MSVYRTNGTLLRACPVPWHWGLCVRSQWIAVVSTTLKPMPTCNFHNIMLSLACRYHRHCVNITWRIIRRHLLANYQLVDARSGGASRARVWALSRKGWDHLDQTYNATKDWALGTVFSLKTALATNHLS
jgi:hypothetical protein